MIPCSYSIPGKPMEQQKTKKADAPRYGLCVCLK